MFQKILKFIKYNNATAIIFTIIFSGMTVSLAASEELRDSIYSSSEIVRSVDNRLIISTDLDTLNFNLRINSVKEDDKNYYVAYDYDALAIQDYIWKNVNLNKILTVDKEFLDGKDLGLYVAKQLGDNIKNESEYLKRVQDLEKNKGESQKIITTEYAGLIGKFLDPEEKVIEGYNPVIPEVVLQPEAGQSSAEAPVVVAPTPPPTVDPNVIKQIVDQYLAERQAQMNTPTSAPQPEADQPSAEAPEPEPELIPVPEPLPTPDPEPEQVVTPIPTPEPEPEPESELIPEPEPAPEPVV